MVEALFVLSRFYAHESCGQCTPCREGTAWLRKIIARIMNDDGSAGDADNLVRISHNIIGNTICPLGDAAALPVISFVTKFRSEFEEWIKRGRPEAERFRHTSATRRAGKVAVVEDAMPTVTIDDKQVTVESGTAIIEAAQSRSSSPVGYHTGCRLGSCRMCLVEVEGRSRLPAPS
jgi:ferredoxin